MFSYTYLLMTWRELNITTRRRQRGFVGAPSLSRLFSCVSFYFKTFVYFILLYLYKQHELFLEYLNFLMILYELDLLFILKVYLNNYLQNQISNNKEHGTLLSRVRF